MNKLKKTLVLVCCAALLVCISVGATVAYLTSKTEVVQNTFTVGDIVITLDEAKVDEDGKPVLEKNEDGEMVNPRVITNEYKLMPGHTYVKDPTVHVAADSEEAYIRMFVTITDFADVKAVLGANFLPENFVAGTWHSTEWPCVDIKEDAASNTCTYEYRYYVPVSTEDRAATDLVPLFEEIYIPGEVDNDALAKLDDMQINIVAYAIQTDGFGGDAAAAWAKYDGEDAGVPVPPIPTPAPETGA